ncbi:hypothetical protein NDU88_001071 [Pleurodeles waltl]|uniref:Uncharacterized protein n=1 Tax=Pleurodeles waltl TaxID=8319 RepID=A0AAV7PBG5_PLEWA|nr:hypothetical protein NDU88_001071 [Pleurodeles waltl]
MGKQRAKAQDPPFELHEADKGPTEVKMVVDAIPQPQQNSLDKILEAIADVKTMLQREIGLVVVPLGLLRTDHHIVANRLKESETAIAELQPAQKAECPTEGPNGLCEKT